MTAQTKTKPIREATDDELVERHGAAYIAGDTEMMTAIESEQDERQRAVRRDQAGALHLAKQERKDRAARAHASRMKALEQATEGANTVIPIVAELLSLPAIMEAKWVAARDGMRKIGAALDSAGVGELIIIDDVLSHTILSNVKILLGMAGLVEVKGFLPREDERPAAADLAASIKAKFDGVLAKAARDIEAVRVAESRAAAETRPGEA